MNNIVSYAEQMLATLEEEPFNAVDSLILSQFSHFHFPAEIDDLRDWRGVKLTDLFRAENFEEIFHEVWDPKNSKRLFTALVASPRFRNVRLKGYTERHDLEEMKQFAAVTFQFDEDICFVAFRGTDASLVGWKEDLNMAFRSPVAAQTDAVVYLSEAASNCMGKIITGGHSKGGNLAVYASAYSEEKVKNRIERIYSHDGPGFLSCVFESEEFRSIENRIDKTVPQSSFVGMLLEQQELFRVIRSNRNSVLQHDPFSWEVNGTDFVAVSSLSSGAVCFDKSLNEWIVSRSPEEREKLVNLLFDLVDMKKIKTTTELQASWQENVSVALRSMSKEDKETKKFVKRAIRELFALWLRSLPERWKDGRENQKEKNKRKQLQAEQSPEVIKGKI